MHTRLMNVVTGLLAAAFIATGPMAWAADPDCEKVLKYGRLRSTSQSKYLRMDVFYSTFCSKTIKDEQEAKQRSDDIGFGWGNFKLNYGGKSRSTQTSEYFQAICSAVSAGTYVQDDQLQVIEQFSDVVGRSYEACINRTGLRLWAEVDPDRREIAYFNLRFNPEAGSATRKLTHVITWLPKAAFTECQGPAKGDSIPVNSTQTFQCSVASGFIGRDVSLQVKLSPDGARSIAAVLAPVPKPIATKPEDAATPSAPNIAPDTKDFPALVLYQKGVPTDSALMGQWLTVKQGYGGLYGGTVDEFGLSISDKSAAFDPSDRLSASWGLVKYRHHEPTQWDLSSPPDDIRISRDITAPRIARFAGYQDLFRGRSWAEPVLTHVVKLSFDASKSKSIGLQAKMTNRCASTVVTAMPAGNVVDIGVRSNPGLGDCDLQLRLCSTKANRLYRPQDACEQ